MLGVLCRISGDKEDGKDRSIHEQELLGKELANDLGIAHEFYTEINVSGTLPIEERPELERLLDNIEDGKITAMFIWVQNRLERNPNTRYIVNETLRENNCKLYVEKGEVNLFDEDSNMYGDIQSLFDAKYVRDTKRLVTKILKRNAEENRVHGIIPFGYKNKKGYYAINDKEAEAVEDIFDLSLSGLSTNKIADELNKKDILTRKNNKWLGSSVYNLLKNTIYKGNRKFGGIKSKKKVSKNGRMFTKYYIKKGDEYYVPIEPIIDIIKWEKTQKNLSENKAYFGPPTFHNYMLKGIVKCGNCGSNYLGVVSKKNNYYACSAKRVYNLKLKKTCNNVGINIARLDNFIWLNLFNKYELRNLVEKHFENSNFEEELELLKQQIINLEKELVENTKEKNRIKRLAVKGFFTDIELQPEVARNKQEKIKIEIQIHNIQEKLFKFKKTNLNSNSIINELDKIKLETSFIDKKIIIQKYVKSIEVSMLNNHYYLKVDFNILNMPSEHYAINKRFKYSMSAGIAYKNPYEILDTYTKNMGNSKSKNHRKLLP